MRGLLVVTLGFGCAVPAGAAESPQVRSRPPVILARPLGSPAGGPLIRSAARQTDRIVRETMAAPRRVRPVPQPGGGTSWIGRHPVLFGTLVGFGGGCIVGASLVGGSKDTFANALDEFACPVIGGMGAAIGAAVGWAVSHG